MAITKLPLEILSLVFDHLERPLHWKLRTVCRLFNTATYYNFDQLLRGKKGFKPVLVLSISQDCDRHHVREYEMIPDNIMAKECLFQLSKTRVGFSGLARLIENTASAILANINVFNSGAYHRMSIFLENGWQDLPLDLPASVRAAYGTLFGHLVRTLQSLGTVEQVSMDSNLQMSLLAQTWRVVDTLVPVNSRDLTLCNRDDCCGENTTVSLASHYSQSECGNQGSWLSHSISLGNNPDCSSEIKWAWKGETTFMKSSIHKIRLCPGMVMEFEALQYEENKVSVGDLRLKVDKWWLLANL